jgi:hypothetical protein
MVTLKIAATMIKIPAPNRQRRPIRFQMPILTGTTTGAGIAMIIKSVTIFMTRGGTILSMD